jgi:hypothetical protein
MDRKPKAAIDDMKKMLEAVSAKTNDQYKNLQTFSLGMQNMSSGLDQIRKTLSNLFELENQCVFYSIATATKDAATQCNIETSSASSANVPLSIKNEIERLAAIQNASITQFAEKIRYFIKTDIQESMRQLSPEI